MRFTKEKMCGRPIWQRKLKRIAFLFVFPMRSVFWTITYVAGPWLRENRRPSIDSFLGQWDSPTVYIKTKEKNGLLWGTSSLSHFLIFPNRVNTDFPDIGFLRGRSGEVQNTLHSGHPKEWKASLKLQWAVR